MTGFSPIGADALGGDGVEAAASTSTVSSIPLGQGPIGSSAIGGVVVTEGASVTSHTGTLSQTLGAVVGSSAGTVTIQGTLSQSLGSITSSAQASVSGTVHGELSQTLGEVTSSGAGAVTVQGSLSSTLSLFGLSAAGTVTSTPSAGDPYFNNVTLLMHCEDFTDVITGGSATNSGGLATIDSATVKFGSGSLKTSTAEVYFADDNKWDFGTGPFTMELWVNPHSSSGARALLAQYSLNASNNPHWMFVQSGGQLYLSYYNGTTYTSTKFSQSLVIGTWYSVCVERDASSVVRVYVNGIMKSKTTGFTHNMTGNNNPLIIGSLRPDLTGFDAKAYFDEIRITKGIARYGSDAGYSVQTAAFPDTLATSIPHSGVLSATLGPVTGGGAGSVTVRGTLSQTLGEVSSQGAGQVTVTGLLDVTLSDILTEAGAVSQTVEGSLDVSLDAVTSSGTGHVEKPPHYGVLSQTLGTINRSIVGVTSGVGDPLFDKVVLLMHAEDFKDKISNTDADLIGSPQVVTSVKKFGNSGIWATTGNTMTFPNSSKWDFGDDPFTIELWFYPNSYNYNQMIIGCYAASGAGWWLRTDGTGSVYFIASDGVTTEQTSPTLFSVTNNTFTHIAVTRDNSGHMKVFLDGSTGAGYGSNNAWTIPVNSGGNLLQMGSAGFVVNAVYDEVRITKGASRYSYNTSFSVPTVAFSDKGVMTAKGDLSKTLDAVQVSSSAQIFHLHFGQLDGAFENVTLESSATHVPIVLGELSQTLEGVVLASDGIVIDVNFGELTSEIESLSIRAMGVHSLPAKTAGGGALLIGA